MNIIGIICAVALPSAVIGASVSAFIIREPWSECVRCGSIRRDHLPLCSTCAPVAR